MVETLRLEGEAAFPAPAAGTVAVGGGIGAIFFMVCLERPVV